MTRLQAVPSPTPRITRCRVWRTTDQTGRVTEYKYNANGQQTSVTQRYTDSDGVAHTIVTSYAYDFNKRVSRTTRTVDGVLVESTDYEYTAGGQTKSTTDRHGLRTEYTYDNRGQETESRSQTVGSDGVVRWLVSRTVYDALGNIVWESYAQLENAAGSPQPGAATYYVYDALGRVVRTEERTGVLFAVDAGGNVSVANAGTLVSYSAQGYDGAGRTAWTENAHGVKTVYVYNRYGDVEYTITDLDGDLDTTADQTAGGKTVYDSQGRQTESVLDRDGDLSTTGDQSSTRYVYDNHGRVIETRYADGSRTSVTYDAMGRKASETDQLGATTRFEYDSMGRLTAVVLPQVKHPETGDMVHVRYEYAYDAQGNHISLKDNIYLTDPSDASTIDRDYARETTFTYDWQGRQTSRTLPDGSKEYFFYNEKGQATRHVSFEGRITTYQYDKYDRLSKKTTTWDSGSGILTHTLTYTYDSIGRVIHEVDSDLGTTTTTYNADGQVTRIASPNGVINYEYDPITGQVTRTWTGTSSSNPITDVRNTYDKLGRLETVETYAREGAALGSPEIAKYIYDIIGNLDEIRHSNGIVTDYNYDLLNRLKDVTHYSPSNAVLQQFVYDYHANGHKSGETATDKDGNTNIWNWDYDALGRLIQERHDNHDDALDYTTDYVFDLVGNRLEKHTDTDGDGIADVTVESVYDENDRLLNEKKILSGIETQETSYDYNVTEQTGKTVIDLINSRIESKTKMEYNAQGRMSKITIETYVDGVLAKIITQEYEYDSSGIKVKQTETVDSDADGTVDSTKTTEYLNDNQNHTGYSQVLEERTSEDGGPVKVTTYTIGHDVLAQYDAVNGLLALLTDGHGSTRAVANDLGQILQQYNYDAYGNAHGFDASEALTNLLYSGEQFNAVSGLQYLRARWYNPQSGTFNRLDPYAGDRESPLSFHKYAYAHSDPVRYADPSGESVFLTSFLLFFIGFNVGVFAASRYLSNYSYLTHNDMLINAAYKHYESIGTTMNNMWAYNAVNVSSGNQLIFAFMNRIYRNNLTYGMNWKFGKITIVSHGEYMADQGKSYLMISNLENRSLQMDIHRDNADRFFSILKPYTDEQSEIYLRGCEIGQDRRLLQIIADSSGAKVIAWTGSVALGGTVPLGKRIEVSPKK